MAKKEFIKNTYQNSKMIAEGLISKQRAVKNLVNLGMKQNSAIINLDVFDCMVNGRMFKRTLSAPTFEYFLNRIHFDFGELTLTKCLDALELHIPYLESTRQSKMILVRKIYQRYRDVLISENNTTSDEELTFPEGREKYRLHKYKERNRELVIQAKNKFKETDPDMKCQICKFSFVGRYGNLGIDFIEAHHIYPISKLNIETETKIEDLAMVCSNCHRMLHVRRPWLSMDRLKTLIV